MEVKMLMIIIFCLHSIQWTAGRLQCQNHGAAFAFKIKTDCASSLFIASDGLAIDKNSRTRQPKCKVTKIIRTRDYSYALMFFTCPESVRAMTAAFRCPYKRNETCSSIGAKAPSVTVHEIIARSRSGGVSVVLVILKEEQSTWNSFTIHMRGEISKQEYLIQNCATEKLTPEELLSDYIVPKRRFEYHKCEAQGITHGTIYQIHAELFAYANSSGARTRQYKEFQKPLKPAKVTIERLNSEKFNFEENDKDAIKVIVVYPFRSIQDQISIECTSTYEPACKREPSKYASQPLTPHVYQLHAYPGATFQLIVQSISQQTESDGLTSQKIMYEPLPPTLVTSTLMKHDWRLQRTSVNVRVKLAENSIQNYLLIQILQLFENDRTENVSQYLKEIPKQGDAVFSVEYNFSFRSIATKFYIVEVRALSAECAGRCTSVGSLRTAKYSTALRSENFEVPDINGNEATTATTKFSIQKGLSPITDDGTSPPVDGFGTQVGFTFSTTTRRDPQKYYLLLIIGGGGALVILLLGSSAAILCYLRNKIQAKKRQGRADSRWWTWGATAYQRDVTKMSSVDNQSKWQERER